MAAKVINFHSPDGKNTYELTFTRDSVEATERAGFQIGQYTQMTNLLSNSRALFYGAFIARNKGIKRKVVDEMFQHIEDKEDLMGVLLEMFVDASKSLLATDTEDKTAKTQRGRLCNCTISRNRRRGGTILLLQAVPRCRSLLHLHRHDLRPVLVRRCLASEGLP